MRKENNNQLTSSRKVVIRDINALLQTAPISRIKTLRDDEGRSKNVDQALTNNKQNFIENNSCVVVPVLQPYGAGSEQQLLRPSALLNKLSGHALTYNGASPSPLVGEDGRRPGEGFPRGFTLIELLVVVLIIGILTAVALPQYQYAVAKSRFIQAKVLAKSIIEAEEVYYLANGKYTYKFEDLEIGMPGGKKADSIDQQYKYRWGDCELAVGSSRAVMKCAVGISGGEIFFWHAFKHSSYKPLSTKCLARGTNEKPSDKDISYRICVNDTQNPSSREIFGTYSYSWDYK